MNQTTIDVTSAIPGRRAIRSFTSEPVSGSLVVEGAERLKAFSDRAKAHFATPSIPDAMAARFHQMLADPSFSIFHGAPTLIVVCATRDDSQAAEDCALAAQNLMLAAHALGLGTCPIGFSRPWLRLAETKRELGIDEHWIPVVPIALGHPAEHPVNPGRRAPQVARR